jgi:putative ABC transport system permease protein
MSAQASYTGGHIPGLVQYKIMNGLSWLWRDLRFGLRSLRKDPRLSVLAILTLGLGIGAAVAIFSILDSAILDPFPFKDPDRLMTAYVHDPTFPKQNGMNWFTIPQFLDIREQNHSFEDMVGETGFDILYNDGKETFLFDGRLVTPNAFEFLGVKPLLGRWITEEDAKPGSPPVFAISYRLWVKQFNQDPKILGTTMTLNGEPRTLVAIMPPRFLFANGDAYIQIPWNHTDGIYKQVGPFPLMVQTFERLKPGATLQSAAVDFDVLARREASLYPMNFPKKFSIMTKNMGEAVSGTFAPMLYLLMGAAFLLLLIACSNVANLLLARASTREREIAIRTSLGASRGRIILQLLVESFLLAVAGCLVGCLIAYIAVRVVAVTVPPGWFAYEAVIEMKPVALYFALGITLFTTVLSGLAPAIHAVRGTLASRLTDTGKGVSGSFRHGKFRAALVVAEVALSILMLVGAGLMMRSLFALERVDLGFNPQNVLVARIPFPQGRYDDPQQKRIFFRQVLERVTALPGVVAATESTDLPPYGGTGGEITIPGKTHPEVWRASLQLISEDYFRTVGVRLVRGRTLSDADMDSARHVVVVNQALVNKYFPNEDPIGKTIKFNSLDQIPAGPHDAYFEIVGITQDAMNQGLQDAPTPEAFIPFTIVGIGSRAILVRTTGDPLLTLPGLRQAVADVDSNLPLTFTGSLEGYLQQFSYAQPQFGLIAMGAFAGIGLLLVIVGVFSVMAYTVSLQTHEIGVRMALGAQQENILRMVLRRGLTLIAVGMVIGLAASFGVMRFVANMFWGVSAADPWTFGVVVILIVAVGLAACFFPARRATRVDPIVALRYE